jgi:hypothetical protein
MFGSISIVGVVSEDVSPIATNIFVVTNIWVELLQQIPRRSNCSKPFCEADLLFETFGTRSDAIAQQQNDHR